MIQLSGSRSKLVRFMRPVVNFLSNGPDPPRRQLAVAWPQLCSGQGPKSLHGTCSIELPLTSLVEQAEGLMYALILKLLRLHRHDQFSLAFLGTAATDESGPGPVTFS